MNKKDKLNYYKFLNSLPKKINKLYFKKLKGRFKLKNKSKKKNGFDPVTNIDKAIEFFLRKEIKKKFPKDGIVGEEFKTKKSKMHIIGESGSGKSTIFNLISRFIDPKEGNIYINDVNIKDVSLSSLRQNISLVSQETMIYNDTFHNNISLGKLNATKREIIKAAKLANIHDFIISQENGYDTVIGEAGSNLSGGQKQRISIARAFLKNSKILLLDEVTSALDSKNSKNILKSINQLSKNKTCIYISHDDYEINKNSKAS